MYKLHTLFILVLTEVEGKTMFEYTDCLPILIAAINQLSIYDSFTAIVLLTPTIIPMVWGFLFGKKEE